MTVKILIFSCNWDGWSCIDSAANAGLDYPASVNIIKLTCLSSLNAGFILKSFEHGVDGVMLLGCKNQQCQYGQLGDNIEKEYNKAKDIIKMLGVKGDRIMLARVEPFDGRGFIKQLNGFIHGIKNLAVPTGAQKGTDKL
ncbi:MAG: hydrogenase iron-sulfur subunit [Dehalococcoidia bacterium]